MSRKNSGTPSDLVSSSSSLSAGFFSCSEYIESKDFTTQEKESTDKLDEENTKSEGVPEFFLDKEKGSEEDKE